MLVKYLTLSTCLFMLGFNPLAAQVEIVGIGSKWSDDFIEWNIYTTDDEDEESGEITLRWQLQRDWSEWDFWLGDERGTINLKWKNDPNQWEISGPDELITARMLWAGDIREWRLTNNSQTLTLKSRWGNNLNEWQLKNDRYGTFDIVAQWEGDPREWNVYDDLDEEVSSTMKVALLFLVTFYTTPKD